MLFSPDLAQIPDRMPGAPARLGVLASGSGTNFGAIARAIAQGSLRAQVACMVCNVAGAGAFQVAREHGIQAQLIEQGGFASRLEFDEAVAGVLESHQVDWVIMAGWMRRVTPEFIARFPQRVLNIHPSLLPSFRGIRAVEQALEAGVKITGVTVHHVVPELDSGPIIAQAAVAVMPEDTSASLHARLQVAEHRLYPLAIAHAIAAQQNP